MKKYVLVSYDEFHGTTNADKNQNKDFILASIPKNIQTKARAILEHISKDSNLDWNEKGELIINGEIINNSHITDLIKCALYSYKNFNPHGYDRFRTALQISNLPQSLLQRGEGLPPPGIPDKTINSNNQEWVWHQI